MAAAVRRNTPTTFLVLCVAALLILAENSSADGRREDEHTINDLVSQACSKTSQDDLPPETCEMMLRSDKRSATAKGPRDLLLVAIDLVERAAAEVDAKLNKHHQGVVVQTCRLFSSLSAHIAPLCRREVQEYKPGDNVVDINVVYATTGDLTYAAQNCWYYVKQLPDDDAVKKAVGKEANYANDLGDLVHAMIIQMIPLH